MGGRVGGWVDTSSDTLWNMLFKHGKKYLYNQVVFKPFITHFAVSDYTFVLRRQRCLPVSGLEDGASRPIRQERDAGRKEDESRG